MTTPWRTGTAEIQDDMKMPSGDTRWSRYMRYFIEAGEKTPREVRLSFEQWCESVGEPPTLLDDPAPPPGAA